MSKCQVSWVKKSHTVIKQTIKGEITCIIESDTVLSKTKVKLGKKYEIRRLANREVCFPSGPPNWAQTPEISKG